MLNLFIDTSFSFLTLILEKNNFLIDSIHIFNEKNHVEKINYEIFNLLKKNNFKLKDINCFYITKGPGTYTRNKNTNNYC